MVKKILRKKHHITKEGGADRIRGTNKKLSAIHTNKSDNNLLDSPFPLSSQYEASFRKRMSEIQSSLSRKDKFTSRLIHYRLIENTSDAVSQTIARPNAMLFGSIMAFVAVGGTFIMSQYYGYLFSGFEIFAAFIIGWIIGIAYDLITSKIKHH